MLAANAYEFKNALETGETVDPLPLVAGVITAAIVGVISIKLLNFILKKDLFKYFGYYCFLLGVIVIIIALIEKFTGTYIGVQQVQV